MDPLIFDRYYHTWREGQYTGEFQYIDDENIGPSFQKQSVTPEGELIHEVAIPEKWELVKT